MRSTRHWEGLSGQCRVALRPGEQTASRDKRRNAQQELRVSSPHSHCTINQAIIAVVFWTRRRIVKPTKPRPSIIVAQVAGSGTAGTTIVAMICKPVWFVDLAFSDPKPLNIWILPSASPNKSTTDRKPKAVTGPPLKTTKLNEPSSEGE